MMKCIRCGHKKTHKYGFVKGRQRYKCPECGYQFVPEANHGMDKTMKLTACILYINGLSFRTIARLLDVSATTVSNWVNEFSVDQRKRSVSNGEATILEFKDLQDYIENQADAADEKKTFLALLINPKTGNLGVTLVDQLDEPIEEDIVMNN